MIVGGIKVDVAVNVKMTTFAPRFSSTFAVALVTVTPFKDTALNRNEFESRNFYNFTKLINKFK